MTQDCFNCVSNNKNDGPGLNCSGYLLKPQNISQLDPSYIFFGRKYSSSVWLSEFKILLLLARKDILRIEQAAYKTDIQSQAINFLEKRENVCRLWFAVQEFTKICQNEKSNTNIHNDLLSSIFNEVYELKNLQSYPEYVVQNSAMAHLSNADVHSSYNLIHMYLDLSWANLLLIQNYADVSMKTKLFERHVHSILRDIICVAEKKFVKAYPHVSKCLPYTCPCFKEFWLLLQLHIEKLSAQHFCETFWHYYNLAVMDVLNLENAQDVRKAVCCLWLTYNVASIHGYDDAGKYIGPKHYRVASNYPLVEKCLKIILTNGDEHSLQSCLNYLSSLQMTWWTQSVTFELFVQLWEHFYKTINAPLSTTLEHFGTQNKTYNFIETLNIIKKCDPTTNSGYEIFLWMLGNYLGNNPTCWPKFKGRIYSKLSISKIATLTEAGLQRFVLLFLVLGEYVNFDELTEKLCSLLKQLPTSFTNDSPVMWSTFLALAQLYIRRNQPITPVAPFFLRIVQQASVNRSKAHLMRLYVNEISKIVDNICAFECHEYLLFGEWIKHYLQWCSHPDACTLLEILVALVDKIHLLSTDEQWTKILNNFVVPSIVQMSNSADAPSQIANIAAALISIDCHKYNVLLEHLAGDSVHVNVTVNFLRKVLVEREIAGFNEDQQIIIIQAWIRISVLNITHLAFHDVTEKVSELPHWRKTFESVNVFLSDEPLCTLIKFFGAEMRKAQNITESALVKRNCELYFGKLDRWASALLANAEKEDLTQYVLRIYTCAGLLFLHCTTAIYTKNKSTCLFHRLTSTLLLPPTVLMNKKPSALILESLRHTWHIFVRGFSQLDYETDAYVKRSLGDLVIRYVPHLYDTKSPIIRCFDSEFNEGLTNFIFERISTTFVACKARATHEFASQALHLIYEFVNCGGSYPDKMILLLRSAITYLFEQIVFIDDNKQIIMRILDAVKNRCYIPDLSAIVKTGLKNIFEKYLAFYSNGVYQMLEDLVNIIPNEISNAMPVLGETITKVEKMRGVGYDNTLRKGYDKIQGTVQKKLRYS